MVFQFRGIWNNFFLPLVTVSSTDLYPITLGLYTWNSNIARHPELLRLVIGGSLVLVIPIVIAILSLQRFWRAGLSEGGVKG